MTTTVTLGTPIVYRVEDDGSIWDTYQNRPVTDPELIARVNAAAAADRVRRDALLAQAATGRKSFLRFGRLPIGGRSKNHRDGCFEPGVSVFAVWITQDAVYADCRGVVPTMLWTAHDRFEVSGTLIEGVTGSDGEPLLADAREVGSLNDLPITIIR